MLVIARQRLLGEIVTAFLHGEDGAFLPVLGQLLFLLGLRGEPLLIGDGGGDLLPGFRELVAHVDDELLENLLRVLGARDQVVDVRPDQRGQTIDDPHLGSRSLGSRYSRQHHDRGFANCSTAFCWPSSRSVKSTRSASSATSRRSWSILSTNSA